MDQLFVPIECQYASEYNHGLNGYHGYSLVIRHLCFVIPNIDAAQQASVSGRARSPLRGRSPARAARTGVRALPNAEASWRRRVVTKQRSALFSLRYLCGLNCACAWRRPSAAALNSGLSCSAASNSGMLSLGFPDSRRAHPRLAWAGAALLGFNRNAS